MERKSVLVLVEEATSILEELKRKHQMTEERVSAALLALERAKNELRDCVTLLAGGVCPEKTPVRS